MSIPKKKKARKRKIRVITTGKKNCPQRWEETKRVVKGERE